jgi:hypothetical protein
LADLLPGVRRATPEEKADMVKLTGKTDQAKRCSIQ